MSLEILTVDFDDVLDTTYSTAFHLKPSRPLLGQTAFAGILSTITLVVEDVDPSITYLTARLTEDETGDYTTMPDRTCSFTRGLTTNTTCTSIFKFEAQFHDDYPMYLFVKLPSGTGTLKKVKLTWRSS